jgi:hypothetical protein
VQSEDNTTCDSALEVCGVRTVDQVLDQHLTRPEEESESEEEVAEHKTTFWDALKGLEAARKCISQSHMENNITVMSNRVENELYRELKEKRNKRLLLTLTRICNVCLRYLQLKSMFKRRDIKV